MTMIGLLIGLAICSTGSACILACSARAARRMRRERVARLVCAFDWNIDILNSVIAQDHA